MQRLTWFVVVSGVLTIWLGFGEHARATDGLIPRRDLFSAANATVVKLHPAGDRIAYVDTSPPARRLLMAEVDRARETKQVQLPALAAPLNLWWSETGDYLIVQAQVGRETRLYSYAVADGATRLLTPKDLGAAPALVRRSERRAGEVLIRAGTRRDYRYWVVDLASGEAKSAFDANGLADVYFDGDYTPRAATREMADGQTEIFRIVDGEVEDEALRVLSIDETNTRRAPRAGIQAVVGTDVAGGRLYVIDHVGRDKSALVSVDLTNGEVETLLEDPDADLRAFPIMDRSTDEPIGAAAYFGDLRRHFLEEEVADDYQRLEQRLGSAAGLVDIGAGDPAWLLVPFDGGPLRYRVYRRATGEVVPVVHTHERLRDAELARRTAHVFTSQDGARLPAHLYIAKRYDADGDGRPDEPLPTIVYVHGGPHIAAPWESWFTNRSFQLLADRGYAVLNVDFRGAGGYGREFVAASHGRWAPDPQRDVVDAARWAVREKIAEPGRIGMWGWSYGGLSTFTVLTQWPEEFACGVAMYGLSDLEAFARRIGRGQLTSEVQRRVGDPTTEAGRARLREQSPLTHVDRVVRPLLVTHGGRDLAAHHSQSDRFVEALAERGHEVTYLFYPDEPHDYRQASSWISFWAVAEQFLHAHLGGRFEAMGTDLEDAEFDVVHGGEFIPGLETPS